MGLGERARQRPADSWIATAALPDCKGHPFHQRLNELLDKHGFARRVEALGATFYHETSSRRASCAGTPGRARMAS